MPSGWAFSCAADGRTDGRGAPGGRCSLGDDMGRWKKCWGDAPWEMIAGTLFLSLRGKSDMMVLHQNPGCNISLKFNDPENAVQEEAYLNVHGVSAGDTIF